MKKAINDAGIGGLTTAIALQQAGTEADIYEDAPDISRRLSELTNIPQFCLRNVKTLR